MAGDGIEIRRLARDELALVREIDRTERIDRVYEQSGTELVERPGDWSAQPWHEGEGEHSFAAQQAALETYVDRGGVALGAFAGERLVGIGVLVPHVRPRVSQLAFLHVSDGFRGRGIGRGLSDELERLARDVGDSELVVSATPSENTVRFYRERGFVPTAEPLPELHALEPEDVHMRKALP